MTRPESDPGKLPDLDALLSLGSSRGDDAAEAVGRSGEPVPGVTGLAGSTVRLEEIPVESVVPNEFQPRRRFEEEPLAALAASIRELGVLQPILVRPDGTGFELIAGERRWRAARRAGLRTIPALVRETDDLSSLEQAVVENLHRKDLNALEEAAAYQQLVDDFGLTQDQVATRVGKSRSAVSNTLRLFQLPPVVQRMVSDGGLSAGHARAVLSVMDPARQVALARRIVAEGLSVRDAEEAAKALDSADSGRRGSADGANSGERGRSKSVGALEIEFELGELLSTDVEVVEASGTGRIVIRFADGEDLDRIYRLLHRNE